MSRPRGTSNVSNFSSLCWTLTPTQRQDEAAILHALHTAFGSAPTVAAENLLTKLAKFTSDPKATGFNGKKLSTYVDNYVSTIFTYPHLYSPADDRAIIKLFNEKLYPCGLKVTWDLVNSTHLSFPEFVAKVRIRIAQHQALHDSEKTVYKSSVKPPATEKSDLSLESTLSCANCSLPHSVDECRKPCVKHPSDKHSGAHCPDLRSTQKKVATVSTSASPFSFLNPSTTVIFDSGSGVNTVPSQNFLSSRNQIPTTLELQTAGAHRFSPTLSGNFRGLHSHVVPEFSDVLISLSNLLSAGNFAIVTDTKMVVVDSNSITVPLLQSFQHAILNSIKFTVPVVDGIYQHSLSDLPSALVTSNSTSRLMNVIHRYETAKFHTLSDLVLFSMTF